jgi:hypothetical protein
MSRLERTWFTGADRLVATIALAATAGLSLPTHAALSEGDPLAAGPAYPRQTERVSMSSAENEANGGSSSSCAVGGHGRYVFSASSATNLVRVKRHQCRAGRVRSAPVEGR